MNAYDFDNTIFRGDSTARFLAFCARRYPRVWRHAPAILGAGALFLLEKVEKTAFKQKMFEFLKDVPDVEAAVSAFWQKNARRVRAWYQAQKASCAWRPKWPRQVRLPSRAPQSASSTSSSASGRGFA